MVEIVAPVAERLRTLHAIVLSLCLSEAEHSRKLQHLDHQHGGTERDRCRRRGIDRTSARTSATVPDATALS